MTKSNEEFSNKIVGTTLNRVYISQIIASFAKAGGSFKRQSSYKGSLIFTSEFREWLKHLEALKLITKEDRMAIISYAENGKLEYEEEARAFLENVNIDSTVENITLKSVIDNLREENKALHEELDDILGKLHRVVKIIEPKYKEDD